ncbi:Leucine-rich repeat-containing protein 63, partial [Galemys pyrenaicus]
KTSIIQPPRVKIIHDETTSTERDESRFLDVSRNQSRSPISIQNILLDYHVQEREGTLSVPKKFRRVSWHFPETVATASTPTTTPTTTATATTMTLATANIFPPATLSPQSRFFRQRTAQVETTKKTKAEEPTKIKSISMSNVLLDLMVLSSATPAPSKVSSRITTPRYNVFHPESHLSAAMTHDFAQSLMDASATVPSPPSKTKPAKLERNWYQHGEHKPTALLKMTTFPGFMTLPIATTPRKPRKQSMLESNDENVSRQRKSTQHEGNETLIQSMRSGAFKTVAATRDETVASMMNLAILNCKMYERNALSLKVLCLKYLQVLILRNNPITEIPSAIEQLKFLRIFNIAFNYITTLPPGSLRKLSINGNELSSFPPGILRLKLKIILFENNYTHPLFWKDVILNNPQKLTHLAALAFLKGNLYEHYDVIPEETEKLLK